MTRDAAQWAIAIGRVADTPYAVDTPAEAESAPVPARPTASEAIAATLKILDIHIPPELVCRENRISRPYSLQPAIWVKEL